METPRQLAEDRLKIAYECAKLGERLADLKIIRAEWWKAMRPDFKSDASCYRSWDLTEEGQEMETISMKLVSKKMKSSAIKTMIEVMSDESRNQY
jgi:hypothetical protein